MKFSINDFYRQFPDNDACLDYLLKQRFGEDPYCLKCGKKASYSRITERKSYACAWCGTHVAPTGGTIFHKSETPLTSWFFAIYLMSQAKNGVAAKEIERHCKVTYKTAFRMMHQIRSLMRQGNEMFDGTVEADETYIGGKAKGIRGRGALNKTPVFGIINRDTGKVYAEVVENVRQITLLPIIEKKVKKGAHVMTDEMHSYRNSPKMGYTHETVAHGAKEYVRGKVHTNSIEGFWSNLKRGLDGTHHSISRKYLQNYLDEFIFRWNHRNAAESLFDLLLARV